MKSSPLLAVLPLALYFASASESDAADSDPVHLGNGIKIGEVHSTSAIIWTRLTQHPERNIDGKPFLKDPDADAYPDLGAMKDAVPGAPGEVRLTWWPKDDAPSKQSTDWQPATSDSDFTHQFPLEKLTPATPYTIVAEARPTGSEKPTASLESTFTTAPAASSPAPVRFTVVTGQDYTLRDDPANGHRIYHTMAGLKPDFFIHTGDIEYYDREGPFADSQRLARFKWNRSYGMPFQRTFHNQTPSYFIKDDHDALKNDCWPGQTSGDLTWEQGLAIFREQVPMGDKTFRTARWGKHLQIWLVEGRDFRSPNNTPDGPEKTIWGEAQKRWFFESVAASDATFRLLVSPTPIVGPDRGAKNDNHANEGFTHEGDQIRKFIGAQKNMFVVCGDRHWQYASVHPETGVREYCSGPTCDKHAGGFSEKNRSEMHTYLKVVGGFLEVEVTPETAAAPEIIFRHHAADGKTLNESKHSAE